MKLWHYTALHHLEGGGGHAGPGILRGGILPNIHPYFDLRDGLVWLTNDATWEQEWSPRVIPGINCDRTESRVGVVIPEAHRGRLLTWSELARHILTPQMRRDLEGQLNPARWFGFGGRVPPGWFRAIEFRGDDPEFVWAPLL